MRLLPHERAAEEIVSNARTWRVLCFPWFNKELRALAKSVDKYETLYAAYLDDLPESNKGRQTQS